MINAQLQGYVEDVIAAKRISHEDVRRLHLNVLEDGVSSRREAELLLALDRTLPADDSWGEALTGLMVDFVVWGSRPTGYVTPEDAAWLRSALVEAPHRDRIVAAVLSEAEEVQGCLDAPAEGGRRIRLAA
jgi:hypothetical protein